MSTKSSFQRCDNEFEKVDEDFSMNVMESIKSISSWISSPTQMYVSERNPNIDQELKMLEQYARKGKKMLSIGTKVIVHVSGEYGGMFTGKVGTIKQIYHKAQKYGIAFEGIKNPESKNGIFWISEKAVTPYGKPTPILIKDMVKKVIFSGDKTIVLWEDGTKTIVTCGEGDCFDPYSGFCAAVTKCMFGSTSNAKRALKNAAKNMPELIKDTDE